MTPTELQQHRDFARRSRLLSAPSPEWHELVRWVAGYYRGDNYPSLAALTN